jgi:hypothetical protein
LAFQSNDFERKIISPLELLWKIDTTYGTLSNVGFASGFTIVLGNFGVQAEEVRNQYNWTIEGLDCILL